MQLNCPVCHAVFPLEVALQHEAGREVMAMLAGMAPSLSQPLLAYIGFFRPAKQQLGWGRALRLMRETLALTPDVPVLIDGLVEAARTLEDKRHQPAWKPLGNHNYLTRCLESAAARHTAGSVLAAAPAGTAPMPRSKAGAGLVALEGMKR